jgi:hypothetical protein
MLDGSSSKFDTAAGVPSGGRTHICIGVGVAVRIGVRVRVCVRVRIGVAVSVTIAVCVPVAAAADHEDEAVLVATVDEPVRVVVGVIRTALGRVLAGRNGVSAAALEVSQESD